MNANTTKSLNDIQTIICFNIRNECQKQSVDMMRLAEEVGISYEYLRHLVSLNGQKSISLYTIYKISLALNVPLKELFSNID